MCEPGWTGSECSRRHAHVAMDLMLVGISDRLFLMGMQLRLRTAVGQVLNRPTYVVEIDNFADISGLPDTLAQRRHWSEADRMVREQEPRIEMQFPVAEDNRETGATVSGNAHQQRQLVEDKLVVRIRVLMSTERDAIRGAQVLVDSLSSGTLLLLLRSKELAREVSFLEPPRAYDALGRAICDNVLYQCPQKGTGDLTMDDSGSNIGFQHWALVGWACLSLGLSVAAVFLCVHAKASGYHIDKWMIAAVFHVTCLARGLYRSASQCFNSRTDPHAAAKLRSHLAEQRLDRQQDDVHSAMTLQNLRFEKEQSSLGLIGHRSAESTVKFTQFSRRDPALGFHPVKPIQMREATPPAESSLKMPEYEDENRIEEFLRNQHKRQRHPAVQKVRVRDSNHIEGGGEVNVDPVSLDRLIAPRLPTHPNPDEDVKIEGSGSPLRWADQRKAQDETYFPHKYSLASAAHSTSPMPPLMSGKSSGMFSSRYSTPESKLSKVMSRRSASPVACESCYEHAFNVHTFCNA